MFAAWTDRQVRGLLGPKALFHRLDGGGQAADGAVGRDGQAHLDGARRQRPLHRLRWERLFRALFCPAPARRVQNPSHPSHRISSERSRSTSFWARLEGGLIRSFWGRLEGGEAELPGGQLATLRGLCAERPPRVCCAEASSCVLCCAGQTTRTWTRRCRSAAACSCNPLWRVPAAAVG